VVSNTLYVSARSEPPSSAAALCEASLFLITARRSYYVRPPCSPTMSFYTAARIRVERTPVERKRPLIVPHSTFNRRQLVTLHSLKSASGGNRAAHAEVMVQIFVPARRYVPRDTPPSQRFLVPGADVRLELSDQVVSQS
jgi:hypothetical protein